MLTVSAEVLNDVGVVQVPQHVDLRLHQGDVALAEGGQQLLDADELAGVLAQAEEHLREAAGGEHTRNTVPQRLVLRAAEPLVKEAFGVQSEVAVAVVDVGGGEGGLPGLVEGGRGVSVRGWVRAGCLWPSSMCEALHVQRRIAH